MWADEVDKWLSEKEVVGGHSLDSFFWKFWWFFFRWSFHICTFGVTFVLGFLIRETDKWYLETIYSRKNDRQNVTSKPAERRIKTILNEAGIDLEAGEEVCFVVEDAEESSMGLIFTDRRLCYHIFKPGMISGFWTNGQFPIAEVGRDFGADARVVNLTIKMKGEPIGKMLNVNKGESYVAFFDAVREAIQKHGTQSVQPAPPAAAEPPPTLPGEPANDASPPVPPETSSEPAASDLEAELLEVKSLLEQGLINEEEAESRRKLILGR